MLKLFITFFLITIVSVKSQVREGSPLEEIESTEATERYLCTTAIKNNYNIKILRKEIDIKEKELTLSKYNWMQNLMLTGNLNEFNFVDNEELGNVFFPRYNFSVRLPLGDIVQNPVNKKMGVDNLEIANIQLEQEVAKTILEVKTKYSQYLTTLKQLNLQTQISLNAETLYNVAQEEYADGSIDLNELFNIQKNYFQTEANRLTLKSTLEAQRNELEEIVGISLIGILDL